jgi:hypothetical protein
MYFKKKIALLVLIGIFCIGYCQPHRDSTSTGQSSAKTGKPDIPARKDAVKEPEEQFQQAREPGPMENSEDPETAELTMPVALFPETNVDVGEVIQGNFIEHDFIVRNMGTAPLEILSVKPG